MAKPTLNIYDLSRAWFDFCFANPEKVKPNHTALYFFAIEHCNRLGWKEKFGLPTSMAKEAIGVKSYNTYSKTITDLVDWGFIRMVEKSKNQYSSNIIALLKNVKAHGKALDKALVKHTPKHRESTGESIDSINKQVYNSTSIQDTNTQGGDHVPLKKFELSYPWDDESFMLLWGQWFKYRAEIKKPYSTFSSAQAELQSLGKHSLPKANHLITLALKNCWKNITDDGSFEKNAGASKLDRVIQNDQLQEEQLKAKYNK